MKFHAVFFKLRGFDFLLAMKNMGGFCLMVTPLPANIETVDMKQQI